MALPALGEQREQALGRVRILHVVPVVDLDQLDKVEPAEGARQVEIAFRRIVVAPARGADAYSISDWPQPARVRWLTTDRSC